MQLPKFSVLNEQLLILNLLRTGVGESIIPLIVESIRLIMMKRLKKILVQ